jgi:hypothetical protein
MSGYIYFTGSKPARKDQTPAQHAEAKRIEKAVNTLRAGLLECGSDLEARKRYLGYLADLMDTCAKSVPSQK